MSKRNNKSNSNKKEMYNVEKILGKKEEDDQIFYKVKWEGESEREATWEPVENLQNIKYMIEEYERRKEMEKSKVKGKAQPVTPKNQKMIGKKRKISELDEEDEKSESGKSEEVVKKKGKKMRKESDEAVNIKTPAVNTRRTKKVEKDKEDEEDEPSLEDINRISTRRSVKSPTSPKSKSSVAAKDKDFKFPTSPKAQSIRSDASDSNKGPNVNGKSSSKNTCVKPMINSEYGVLGQDTPLKISIAKQHDEKPDLIACEIIWKTREDGVTPKNSWYSNKEIKEYHPLLLCHYYEARLKFGPKKSG